MRNKIIVFGILCLLYFLSYAFVRQSFAEVWEKDGKVYVIFPENKILYYFYRPLSIIDDRLTGTNSHIGQHR